MTLFSLFKPLILLFLILNESNTGLSLPQPRAGCSFNLANSSPTYPPHLFNKNKALILPVMVNSVRTIQLDEGEEIDVSCPGIDNVLSATRTQVNQGICTSSNKIMLMSNGIEYSYNQLGCTLRVKDTIIENGTCADGQGTILRIGWQSGDDFIPLYDSCHDKNLALNYYTTNYIVGRSADADDKSHDRPTFSQATYYPGLQVNTLYSTATQTQTIAGILNSTALANEYINQNQNLFFSRGHMAPDGDFVDWSSQEASYYFMNAAPQWQTFNGGNWNLLENAVRGQAISRDIDLIIYTGTFGVTTLADIKGVQQNIYLAFDENKNGLIPAPKYFWKLIYHPATNTATAVVGINNPYNNVNRPIDVFCPDVCNQIPWVNWGLTNIKNGYTFCCTSADLHKAINFAPDLDVPLFV